MCVYCDCTGRHSWDKKKKGTSINAQAENSAGYIFGFMLNRKPTSKIWVFTHKAAFMQRIADYVRTGHQAYIQGVTETSKMHATWEKLALANPVFDDKLKAFRAREKGLPTGRLLMYQNTNAPEKIHWILLIHGRTDQLPPGEKWRHAEDSRSRVQLTGYELLRVTKEGVSKPVWTWRYSVQRYQDIRDSMVQAIRSNRDQDLKNLIKTIFGTMGFSGSREQAKALVTLMKSEWKLRRAGSDMLLTPKLISWVRRKSDKGVWLVRGALPPPREKDRPVDLQSSYEIDSETLESIFDGMTEANDWSRSPQTVNARSINA